MSHVHEILEMINSTGESYTVVELQQAVISQFGRSALFNSCSIEDMNSIQAVEFLVNKGKFVPKQSGTSCCGSCGGE